MLSDGVFNHTDTGCQKLVNFVLDELKVEYINEYNCKYVSIDNYLVDFGLMIEVMGTFWHADPRFYSSIYYQQQLTRIFNDSRKNKLIKTKYGINILYLWEHDIINNLELCKELIKLYIHNQGKLDNYHSFNYSLQEGRLEQCQSIVPYFVYNKKELSPITHIKIKKES